MLTGNAVFLANKYLIIILVSKTRGAQGNLKTGKILSSYSNVGDNKDSWIYSNAKSLITIKPYRHKTELSKDTKKSANITHCKKQTKFLNSQVLLKLMAKRPSISMGPGFHFLYLTGWGLDNNWGIYFGKTNDLSIGRATVYHVRDLESSWVKSMRCNSNSFMLGSGMLGASKESQSSCASLIRFC